MRREDQLTSAIAQWLEAERASHAAAFAQMGVARRVQSDRPTVIERSEDRITYGRRPRLVNPLTVRGFATLPTARIRPPTPAAAIHDVFGERCFFWSPLVRPNFEDNPLAWIDEAVLDQFAFSFAASLDDLTVSATTEASTAAKELMAFLSSDVVRSRTWMAIGGVRVGAPLVSGSVTLRPLTDDEYAAAHDSGDWAGGEVGRPPTMASETAVLSVIEDRPKRTNPGAFTGDAVKRVILGMQLVGLDPSGSGWMQQRDLPVTHGTMGFPLALPRFAAVTDCAQELLDAATRLAAAMPQSIGDPRRSADVALGRFHQGCVDRSSADALVEFVIALEAVLLQPEDTDRRNQGELRFRFGLNGALLLRTDPINRHALRKELVEVYDARSAIVHGGILDRAEIARLAPRARALAAEVLVHGLTSGWPTGADFLRLALE